MLKKISIVIPCYNEEETIAIIYKELVQVDRKLQDFYFEYIFINDGSTDDTLLKLRQLSKKQNVHYLSFSRNFGKEAALYAGLKEDNGEHNGFA